MVALSGDLGVREIIRLLKMQPHPEGGHYAETYRSPADSDARGGLSLIYYLLQADEVSAWHRVDADEVWLWQAGGPLALTVSPPSGKGATYTQIGPELRAGQSLQGIVPAHHWQTAETLGAWTLVSCAVGPAFQFESFELASKGWRPEV